MSSKNKESTHLLIYELDRYADTRFRSPTVSWSMLQRDHCVNVDSLFFIQIQVPHKRSLFRVAEQTGVHALLINRSINWTNMLTLFRIPVVSWSIVQTDLFIPNDYERYAKLCMMCVWFYFSSWFCFCVRVCLSSSSACISVCLSFVLLWHPYHPFQFCIDLAQNQDILVCRQGVPKSIYLVFLIQCVSFFFDSMSVPLSAFLSASLLPPYHRYPFFSVPYIYVGRSKLVTCMPPRWYPSREQNEKIKISSKKGLLVCHPPWAFSVFWFVDSSSVFFRLCHFFPQLFYSCSSFVLVSLFFCLSFCFFNLEFWSLPSIHLSFLFSALFCFDRTILALAVTCPFIVEIFFAFATKDNFYLVWRQMLR